MTVYYPTQYSSDLMSDYYRPGSRPVPDRVLARLTARNVAWVMAFAQVGAAPAWLAALADLPDWPQLPATPYTGPAVAFGVPADVVVRRVMDDDVRHVFLRRLGHGRGRIWSEEESI